MSDHIAGVTAQDDVGVIEKAAFDAKAIVAEQVEQAGAVEAAEQQAVGQEAIEHQEASSDGEVSAPEAKGSTEGDLAVNMAVDATGIHPGIQVAGSLAKEISNPDPAKFDAGKIAKQTNGMSGNVQTVESVIKQMKSGDKLGSFKGAFDKGADVLDRANIGSDFLSGKGVQSGSKAASAELSSLRQVKQAVYGHRLASEQKLTQAQVALEQKGPQMAQTQQQLGMSGPGMGLGTGPKFRPPKDEQTQDNTTETRA